MNLKNILDIPIPKENNGGGGEPHIDMKPLNYETIFRYEVFIDGKFNTMDVSGLSGEMKEFTLTKRKCYTFLPYTFNKNYYDIEKLEINGITHIITENTILNISLVIGRGNYNKIYFIKKKNN